MTGHSVFSLPSRPGRDDVRYRLDPTWWRRSSADGTTVVAGSPSRLFRFAPAANDLLARLESGEDVGSTARDVQLRLVDAGAVHPLPTAEATHALADVTVVIPAHLHDAVGLHALLERLPEVGSVIVVDDASTVDLSLSPSIQVLRNDRAHGPAAARNRALDHVRTPLILFLDADIELPPSASEEAFWSPLLVHLNDTSIALVAPRVRSSPGPSPLERYEMASSPLDLGPAPGLIRPGTRIAYVPSAAILVRTDVMHSLGGFDESLRFGEDVDLLWRLSTTTHRARYEPCVEVFHRPRSTWWELIAQRFRYGTSAAPLEQRHPGAARALRLSKVGAASLALVATGHPVIAGGVTVDAIRRLAEKLERVPDRFVVSSRLIALGHLRAVTASSEAAVRSWWPVTALASLVSRRCRVIAGTALIVRATSRRPSASPWWATIMAVIDDLAYGAGVWYGAIRSRHFACLRPIIG